MGLHCASGSTSGESSVFECIKYVCVIGVVSMCCFNWRSIFVALSHTARVESGQRLAATLTIYKERERLVQAVVCCVGVLYGVCIHIVISLD